MPHSANYSSQLTAAPSLRIRHPASLRSLKNLCCVFVGQLWKRGDGYSVRCLFSCIGLIVATGRRNSYDYSTFRRVPSNDVSLSDDAGAVEDGRCYTHWLERLQLLIVKHLQEYHLPFMIGRHDDCYC